MTRYIIGTCSLCGGNVMDSFESWEVAQQPTRPRCVKCGATRKYPVVEMELEGVTNSYEPPTVTPHNPLDTVTGTQT